MGSGGAPVSSHRSTLGVLAQAYLAIHQDISQGESVEQTFTLFCDASEKGACGHCKESVVSNAPDCPTPAQIAEACESVCICRADVSMDESISVNFGALQGDASDGGPGECSSKLCKFQRAINANLAVAIHNAGGQLHNAGELQKNTIWKSTENIFTQVRSESFRRSLQSATAQQDVTMEGGAMDVTNISLTQISDIVSSTLQQHAGVAPHLAAMQADLARFAEPPPPPEGGGGSRDGADGGGRHHRLRGHLPLPRQAVSPAV